MKIKIAIHLTILFFSVSCLFSMNQQDTAHLIVPSSTQEFLAQFDLAEPALELGARRAVESSSLLPEATLAAVTTPAPQLHDSTNPILALTAQIAMTTSAIEQTASLPVDNSAPNIPSPVVSSTITRSKNGVSKRKIASEEGDGDRDGAEGNDESKKSKRRKKSSAATGAGAAAGAGAGSEKAAIPSRSLKKKKYACPKCEASFHGEHAFINHGHEKHEGTLSCERCKKTISFSSFKKHMACHQAYLNMNSKAAVEMTCNDCKMFFKTESHCTYHKKNECSASISRTFIKEEKEKKIKKQSKEHFYCQICKKRNPGSISIQGSTHTKLHKRYEESKQKEFFFTDLTCHTCGLVFTSRRHFDDHQKKNHSNNPPAAGAGAAAQTG